MKTPILDQYIFDSFERIKGLNINCIEFNLQSENKINESFVLSLFHDIDILFLESKISKNEFHYKLVINWKKAITGNEYALLLGKVYILCGKLFINLITAGVRS